MNLGDYMGEATLRFREPDHMWLNAFIGHVNQAVRETQGALRQAGSEKGMVIDTVDLTAERIIYDLPPNVSDVVRAERLDVGGDPHIALPLVRIPYQQDDLEVLGLHGYNLRPDTGMSLSYVLMPGGKQFRLTDAPLADYAGGVCFTFWPSASKMRELSDEPQGVPEEIHECVLAKALNRTRQSAGLTLQDPKAFMSWLQQMQAMEGNFLYPSDAETPPRWVETGYYS